MRRTLSERINRRVCSRIAIGWATASVLALAQGFLAVPAALATAAPTATTGAGSQVAFASATVTGTVNPNGSATTYHFEYGTTAAYGTQTSAASAGAGSAAVAVSQPLSGLSASTTYHYRLVAVSAGGTVDGKDATFATPATPAPTASTSAATAVSSGAATLNGSVNPEGVPTSYHFEYGTTAAYGNVTPTQSAGSGTTAQAAAAALSGLAANTTYHYRVVAASTGGGTVVGADLAFTTAKLSPPAVATAAASGVSTAAVVLNGTVNAEGLAATYHFQYGTTSRYGHYTPIHSAGSGTTSVAVSQPLGSLAAGTTYHYRVVAVNAGGTVVGKDATFATPPTPSATTGSAAFVTTSTANLTGSVDPHGVATTYYFEYGTKSPTTPTPVASAGAGVATIAVSAPLSGLAAGTSYVYRLVAVGAATSTGATRSFTTAKIPPSLSLSATADPALAGASVTFDGKLSGTGVGVRTVALEIEPFPYTGGFRQLGADELTSAVGTFSFTLPTLDANTMVRAVTVGGSPSLVSPTILEQAVVRISLKLRRHGRSTRFFGLISPAGAPVQIQVQRRFRGRWLTVARATTHPISPGAAAYSRTIRQTHLGVRYRVLAHVRDGSLRSGASRTVTLH